MSKRPKGTGWKFFRPASVIAGFLVLAKRGFTLSFRTCSMIDQKEGASARRVVVKDCSASLALMALALVVQGSLSDVKLASAMTISDLLAAFSMGNRAAKEERTEIARLDLSRLALIRLFCSAIAACQSCLYARRGNENAHLLMSPPERYRQTQDQEALHY